MAAAAAPRGNNIEFDDGDLDIILPVSDRGLTIFPSEFDSHVNELTPVLGGFGEGASTSGNTFSGASTSAASTSTTAIEERALLKRSSEYGSSGPLFDLLPDEVMIRIHSFLDPPSLGRMAQTCTRFHTLSQDVPMWKELSKRQAWLTGQSGFTRSYFVRKFLSFRTRQTAAAAAAARREHERQVQNRRDNMTRGLLCATLGRPWEWLSAICLVLFTIFCILKWDRAVQWPWGAIFVPLWIFGAQIFIAPTSLAVMSKFMGSLDDIEDDLEPENTCRPVMFNLFFVLPLTTSKRRNHWLLLSLVFLLMWYLVMLGARCSGGNIPWGVVNIPLFLITIHFFISPFIMGKVIWKSKYIVDRITLLPVSILLFLFVMFLTIQLSDAMDWSWHGVFAPIYCLICYIFLLPIPMTVLRIFCRSCFEDVSNWGDEYGPMCIAVVILDVVLLTPLLTMLVMLAQVLDGARDYWFAEVFIPLFILEGVLLLACGALHGFLLFKN